MMNIFRRRAGTPDSARSDDAGNEFASDARCRLILIRHGQRIDETPEGREWMENAGDRWFDPPLTREGHGQAQEAGQLLAESGITVDTVHVSPLQRTLETAMHVQRQINAPNLHVVHGLASCAAAVKRYGLAQLGFLDGEALATEVPELTVNDRDTIVESFEDAVERLCQDAIRRNVDQVVVVTHREGIRDLSDIAGTYIRRTPYCCRVDFEYAPASRQWKVMQS
mmetsp:Transcript_2511/g.4694  ORF Transcript_2511/g.4694 Transcript_2511/m.4694 type:complete len:225 (-) Transcript_2511:65-739(-)